MTVTVAVHVIVLCPGPQVHLGVHRLESGGHVQVAGEKLVGENGQGEQDKQRD